MKRFVAALVLAGAAACAWAQQETRFPQDYQGLWWNPLQSGWGVGVFGPSADGSNAMASVLFAYGADGRPTWYIAPDLRHCAPASTASVSVTCGGTIYRTSGSWYGAPYIASSLVVREAGQWSVSFTGPSSDPHYGRTREMSFGATIDGAALHRDNLVLQDIAGSAVAAFDPAASQFTGMWWDPDENGWGVGVFHYRGVVFAVLFVYNATRQPTWFATVLRESVPMAGAPGSLYRQFDGPLFDTRGTPWFVPGFALTQARHAGTAQLIFATAGAGAALTYSVDGVSVTKTLRRLSAQVH